MAINVKDNTITFNGEIFRIDSWVVWYMTPMGLFQDRMEAVQRVTAADLDPCVMVIPVPVALGPNNLYEVAARN